MRWHFPRALEDLFEVFVSLEAGESAALAITGAPAPETTSLPSGIEGPVLGVLSSGSTGKPKLVWKSWRELLSEVRLGGSHVVRTWASCFEPTSFAGVQVALQAWKTGCRIFSVTNDWRATWKLLDKEGPQALSGTPTFLDLLLQNEGASAASPPTQWQPGQITLGGEVLRSVLGRRFRQRFPDTRFTVVYASAELGVLLKTNRLDGRYEIHSLSRRFSGWRLSDESVLMVEKDGVWMSTGDLAEMNDGLIRILGRAGSVANVAGVKVNLDEISALAEEVPGVRRAVATVEPNSVVGQVVVLHYALDQGASPEGVLERLQSLLRQMLRKEAWPRRWVLDEVGTGRNSKRAVHVVPERAIAG